MSPEFRMPVEWTEGKKKWEFISKGGNKLVVEHRVVNGNQVLDFTYNPGD